MKKVYTWLLGICLTFFVVLAGAFSYWYFASTNYHLTGVPVLNYHQVNNKFHTVLTMKPKNFEEQIQYLSESGYHSITLEQFSQYMSGEGDLPDKPVLITFDDGYEDNYEYAYPILKKYNMIATFFLITDFIGRPGYLTWDPKKLLSGGWEKNVNLLLSRRESLPIPFWKKRRMQAINTVSLLIRDVIFPGMTRMILTVSRFLKGLSALNIFAFG